MPVIVLQNDICEFKRLTYKFKRLFCNRKLFLTSAVVVLKIYHILVQIRLRINMSNPIKTHLRLNIMPLTAQDFKLEIGNILNH